MRPVAAQSLLLPVLALAITGCHESPQDLTPADIAQVRLLHASPDAPPLDLYAGPSTSRGQLVSNNIAYGNATSFQSMGVGSQALMLTRTGAPYDQLYGAELDLKKGDKIDLVAAGEADGGLHVVVLHESDIAPDAGTVRLRVLNASPDATPMGVDLGNNGSIEIPDLALLQDSGAQGIEIPAGSPQRLGIVVGGETIANFSLPGLPSGSDALLVLTGYAAKPPRDSDGLSLLAPGLGLVKQDVSVYFGNLVRLPGSETSLDVYSSGSLLVSDLQLGSMVRIPLTSFGFTTTACPHGAAPHSSSCFPIGQVGGPTVTFQPGHRYLVLVHFKVEDFLSTFFDDTFDPGQADPQLRFINSARCCTVDVGVLDGGQLTVFDGYSPIGLLDGAVSSGPVLQPGNYTLGFRFTGDTTVYGFETVLSPGSRSFAVFGPSSEGTPEPQLYLIDTATQPWSLTVHSPLP